MSFNVEGPWKSSFPHFSRPEVVGHFSVNEKREYLPDLSQLKYFSAPKRLDVRLNLKEGYEHVRRKPAEADEERLDHLLRWILLNSEKIRAPPETGRWLQPQFVCFRGLLTKLWCTPFEKQEGWIICAAKWHGTIYLCAFDTEEKKRKNANVSEKMLQFMSWGFKFEQYMLSDSPDKRPDTSHPVNEAEEFCCLFQSRLGENRLLYGAEMDGVSSTEVVKEPVSWKDLELVELKTSRIIQNQRQYENFRRFKLIKWWCQSFLVGIDSVLCGFRDDDGIVRELKNYDVPEMTRISKGTWSASTCMNFCDAFLEFVKSVVRKDQSECVYKFEWTPGDKIRVEEVDGLNEYSFLPKWYFDSAEPYSSKLATY